MNELEEPNEPYGIRPGPGRKHPDDDGQIESQPLEKKEFRPSCVNCRLVRVCIITKAVRDFKGHIQIIDLHCKDWEAEEPCL